MVIIVTVPIILIFFVENSLHKDVTSYYCYFFSSKDLPMMKTTKVSQQLDDDRDIADEKRRDNSGLSNNLNSGRGCSGKDFHSSGIDQIDPAVIEAPHSHEHSSYHLPSNLDYLHTFETANESNPMPKSLKKISDDFFNRLICRERLNKMLLW